MNEITLSVSNGAITTTSNQIADHFGKNHKSVLRAIDNLDCSEEFRQRNFAPTVCERENPSGGALIQSRAFTVTKDGFVFLGMGFTGKEVAQWKEKYISAFNAMEAELRQVTAPTLPSEFITPDQAQHLKELVQIIVASEKQTFGETWARLQRKFKVNSYLKLTPDQFDAACDYLRGKVDGPSMAVIAQKHFPQIALPATAPTNEEIERAAIKLLTRPGVRVMMSFSEDKDGCSIMSITSIPKDTYFIAPNEFASVIGEPGEISRSLLPGIIHAAVKRLE
jgi:Rha family phage regulatory protein